MNTIPKAATARNAGIISVMTVRAVGKTLVTARCAQIVPNGRRGTMAELRNLASAAGKAVGGEWSVDILETRRGWYITDMAEAYKSWHWKDCPNNLERK